MNLHAELHGSYTSALNKIQVVFLSRSSRPRPGTRQDRGIENQDIKILSLDCIFGPAPEHFFVTELVGVHVGVIWTRLDDHTSSRGEMDSIIFSLERQRHLLEQVLDLAVGGLNTMEGGRLDDTERLLLMRAERMQEFVMAEAKVAAKMSDIKNDLTLDPRSFAELDKLNRQIITLVDCIISIDERAEELGKLLAARITARA